MDIETDHSDTVTEVNKIKFISMPNDNTVLMQKFYFGNKKDKLNFNGNKHKKYTPLLMSTSDFIDFAELVKEMADNL